MNSEKFVTKTENMNKRFQISKKEKKENSHLLNMINTWLLTG
ncbi:hypothetical protein SAMN05880573_12624 [Chryseobacterium sp. RU33C]|nr:hypothetical protein SAMN05880573_12624 [Chryseobacterium sp. RU33C]